MPCPSSHSLHIPYYTSDNAEPLVAVLRGQAHLTELRLVLVNTCGMFDADADGASWIDSGDWDLAPCPPLAGLPLRSLTIQGAVLLPPDWRKLTDLRKLRAVSSPEYGRPADWDGACFTWDSEPAPGLTSLTRLEVKSIVPGAAWRGPALHTAELNGYVQRVRGMHGMLQAAGTLSNRASPFVLPPPPLRTELDLIASLPALRVLRDIRGRQPAFRAAVAAARPDVRIIAE